MKNSNRDLLVLVKDASSGQDAMQDELQQLNLLLLRFETPENFCRVHETMDMQKYRHLTGKMQLPVIQKGELKPFIFICNKN